jgi:hypothetical protein
MRLVRAPLTDTMYTQPTPLRPSWGIGCGARFSPVISISLYLFQMIICLYIMYIRGGWVSGVAMRLIDPASNDTDVHPTTPLRPGRDIGCGARFSPVISISLYQLQMIICLYIMYIRGGWVSGVAMRLTDPPSNDTDVHPTTPF